MDPDPSSQADVERLIFDLMKAVGKVTVEVGKRAATAAEAETDYRIRYAQEMLKAEGPMELRKAQAEVACSDLLRARKTADALLMSAREAGQNARSRLDAARTLATSLRAAMGAATGFGG